jgi:HTH-type transcriptional regulator/antitoxin HigA
MLEHWILYLSEARKMELRVIRDDLQHAALLEQATELALLDPLPGSEEAERLAVISVLLEKYEAEQFKIESPDPIDAIVYRLAELGLKQKDLADILGSKSRASEILGRKRDLTVDMIRLIHENLRIPVEVLIGERKQEASQERNIAWDKFPLKEMKRRGWLDAEIQAGHTGEQLIRSFFAQTAVQKSPAFFRRTLNGSLKEESQYAIHAWIARVLIKAREAKRPDVRYVSGSITDEFLRQLAKLSRSDDGPLLAREFLAMKGILLVVEEHLPKTRLDGAAILDGDGVPVIGLTLRYNRVDYFWFTLMHELVHVQRHLGRQNSTFVDEEDADDGGEREAEANIFAAEAFIPRQVWRSSDACRTKRGDAVLRLAEELRIHPAIVAGRIRRENNNYRLLSEFFKDAPDIKKAFGITDSSEK